MTVQKYRILIKKAALRFIERQSHVQRERLLKAIYKLPYEGDIKYFSDLDMYRLRVGGYRIIYTVSNDILTVSVTDAGNRGDVYKR